MQSGKSNRYFQHLPELKQTMPAVIGNIAWVINIHQDKNYSAQNILHRLKRKNKETCQGSNAFLHLLYAKLFALLFSISKLHLWNDALHNDYRNYATNFLQYKRSIPGLQ